MNIFETVMTVLGPLFVIYFLWSVYLYFTKGIDQIGVEPLKRCFEGLELHETQQSGDVSFVYHTYRGLLFCTIQEEHHVFADPETAKTLLKRLLRYNLTWGMRTNAVVFIPILAVGNYFAQKGAIARQAKQLASSDKG
ncbi:hypothetical protein ACYFX5_14160 [Bremerella sp. T1]|uniref:hypothetical protein n=1 Tax=Bremerella sp. TYQ1 TaxID=3119568 RepID=UPI001CCC0C01|nr:hypothetical protein [Bremerella volcania]UBM34201.1 hypothetical protein LA756_16100 [Bremerella volcania]